MASIDTIALEVEHVQKFRIAVISLDFPSTACWASTSPASVA
jgi:hypothetical protein